MEDRELHQEEEINGESCAWSNGYRAHIHRAKERYHHDTYSRTKREVTDESEGDCENLGLYRVENALGYGELRMRATPDTIF